MLTKRVLVRFSPEEVDRLRAIAEARGESLAGIIREAVTETYFRPGETERLEAVRLMGEMRLPVADWEQMERESSEGYPVEDVSAALTG
jgi:hypothetical protein